MAKHKCRHIWVLVRHIDQYLTSILNSNFDLRDVPPQAIRPAVADMVGRNNSDRCLAARTNERLVALGVFGITMQKQHLGNSPTLGLPNVHVQ